LTSPDDVRGEATGSKPSLASMQHARALALYAYAAERAEAMGWRLNLDIKGHRVCDFPHAIYQAGKLADFGLCPSTGLRVLEIQIAHPTRGFGAFFEDLLVADEATELVFSYGTLQLESVQLATFGRRLDGWVDQLPGYGLGELAIGDAEVVATSGKTHHPIVAPGMNRGRGSRGWCLR
jgi:hypothetical protein